MDASGHERSTTTSTGVLIYSYNGFARNTYAGRSREDLLQMVRDPRFFSIATDNCIRLNTKLESKGYDPMTSLVKDLSDGVKLIQLMVCLWDAIL